MTGQIASPSIFSIGLVAFIIGISMVVGAVDLIRQPGWAWRSAEESKIAYLVLVLLLPLVGLGMYLFGARSKVVKIASAGRAASLPFERFGEESARKQLDDGRPVGTIAPPVGLGSFGGLTGSRPVPEAVMAMETVSVGGGGGTDGGSRNFFSTGGSATRAGHSQVGLATAYRPKQRTSLPAAEGPALAATVPAGWKADPTGRHQFRYWDGTHWTENVADAGVQARDSVNS